MVNNFGKNQRKSKSVLSTNILIEWNGKNVKKIEQLFPQTWITCFEIDLEMSS